MAKVPQSVCTRTWSVAARRDTASGGGRQVIVFVSPARTRLPVTAFETTLPYRLQQDKPLQSAWTMHDKALDEICNPTGAVISPLFLRCLRSLHNLLFCIPPVNSPTSPFQPAHCTMPVPCEGGMQPSQGEIGH